MKMITLKSLVFQNISEHVVKGHVLGLSLRCDNLINPLRVLHPVLSAGLTIRD